MKVLTKYALKEHITPFLFAFFVTTFVLILETLPRLVSLVIDKSVSIWIVLELIGLNLAWMLALSTPMSILVATISAFGRLGSDSEMMAMKASGVNPVRILVPVVLASIAIAGIMIHFNDQILPGLNHKARVLMGDI
ncbi:MAG: LptF/LptG family permease, partial [candidate division Zixibacteria bacterium]|nr:LptF/LptG family permease [candidate division Zixibacteria bacterium]